MKTRTPRRPARVAADAPPPSALPGSGALAPTRLRAALAVLAAVVLYGVAESVLWRDALWGFHFYGFLPRGVLAAAAAAALVALSPLAARGLARMPSSPAPRWLPWAMGAAAAALFWLLRERHLFWGDARPLSIFLPQGQSFHPDEPLTLFVHQLLYRAGGGRWSAPEAVAAGSALSGGLFAGWAVHWLSRRGTPAWPLAAGVLLAQGAMQIFFGHVENYAYLALCFLLFATWGVDFLEGRGDPYRPLLAALLGFAFHILGGLAAVPALVLVGAGLRDGRRRRATLAAAALVMALLVAGSIAAAPLYGGESPLGRFLAGFTKVLSNRDDFRAASLLSWRQAVNVWSVLWLTGPLSALLLVPLLSILPGARFVRSARGLFLLAAAAVYLGPVLLTGEGNLGAARNWDLHAAPFVFASLAGVLLVAGLPDATARRLLLGLLAVSLFHTAPWVALNASFERTVARIAELPLGKGRAPMMLGTHYFNEGALTEAERWFRASVRQDPENVNAQSGLGLTLARQRRYAEALPHLREAVRLKPASAQLRYDLVTMLLQLARWPEAAQTLSTGLAYEPRDRRSWLTLADARRRLAQPDSAALALEEGLRYFPGDPDMERALGDVYALWVGEHGRRGERDAARAVLARFAARFPGDPRVATLRAVLGAP